MTRRAALLAAVLVLLGLGSAAQGGGPQLVVVNRSSATAEVASWRYDGGHWDWVMVATVPAGYKVPISDVRQDDRYRAFLRERGEYRYHTVDLRRGNGQDEWPID